MVTVFSPAPIEFPPVRIRQFEFTLALGISETLPQSHREFGPVTGR
jgi:hypothetical protein